MMTPEENDLLCRVEGDAPMGQIMRRHWIAACLSEEVAEPDGAPVQGAPAGRGPGGVPRQQGPARRARRILLAPPRLARSTRATRNAGCAASITAGSSTWTATWSRWRRSRPTAAFRERVKHKAYPAREAGGFVWCYMGPADEMPRIRAAGFCADAGRARQRHQGARALQLGADPRRPDRLGAFLEPAFLRHGAGAGRRREGDRRQLAAALDRQGAALPDRAHQLRLPLRGDPPADPERGDARLHPHHGLHRAVHRADPAEQRAQRRDVADAGRRHTTRCSISSPGTAPTSRASMPTPGASSTCCNGASTSTANFNGIRTRANDYQQDRAAMKAGNFTGIKGIPNQDIAMWEAHGADQRPLARSARRERRRGGGVPPPDGRGGARHAATAGRRSARRARASRMRRSAPTKAWCPKPTNWRTLGGGSEAPQRASARLTEPARTRRQNQGGYA